MSEAHRLLHSLVEGQTAVAWAHLWTSSLLLFVALVAAGWRRLTPGARETILSLGLAKLVVPGTALLLALRAAGWDVGGDGSAPAPSRGASVALDGLVAIQAGGTPSELPCLIALLWLGGALATMLGRTVRRRRLVRDLLRGAEPLDPTAARSAAGATSRVAARGIAVLRGCGEVPFTFGTLRPRIVLPAAGRLEPALERSLLAHELAHVRRNDDLRAGLNSFVAALFWFHPLVWIAARRLTLAREAACDRAATREVGIPAYLAALDHLCRGAIAPAGLTGWASGALRERIGLLMDARRIRFVPSPFVLVIALVATAGATVASGFAAPLPAQRRGADDYRLEATAAPRGDVLLVQVEVHEEDGAPLAVPQILLRPGEDATTSTVTGDGRDVFVKVRLDRHGSGGVRCRIRRNGEVLYDRTIAVAAPGAPSVSANFDPAGGINLSLRDADLHEVLWTFARMRGLALSLGAGVEGTLTLELEEVPWAEALDIIARTNRLSWQVSGDELVVTTAL
jgi:hypothetical protein